MPPPKVTFADLPENQGSVPEEKSPSRKMTPNPTWTADDQHTTRQAYPTQKTENSYVTRRGRVVKKNPKYEY